MAISEKQQFCFKTISFFFDNLVWQFCLTILFAKQMWKIDGNRGNLRNIEVN